MKTWFIRPGLFLSSIAAKSSSDVHVPIVGASMVDRGQHGHSYPSAAKQHHTKLAVHEASMSFFSALLSKLHSSLCQWFLLTIHLLPNKIFNIIHVICQWFWCYGWSGCIFSIHTNDWMKILGNTFQKQHVSKICVNNQTELYAKSVLTIFTNYTYNRPQEILTGKDMF